MADRNNNDSLGGAAETPMLVTGGSKGIGRAIAVHFARPGKSILINYAHDDGAARATASEVSARGGTPHLIKLDLSEPGAPAALITEVGKTTDKLGQIVHCAVYPVSSPALKISVDDFERATRLNGAALLYLVQAALPLLSGGSTIFFLSSRGSKVAVPNYVAIGAPKAMGEALVRYLAVELAPRGVRVHIVSASALLTDAFRAAVPNPDERFAAAAANNPSRRNLTFEDVSMAVEFLASDRAQMITGRELFIDGGLYVKA